MAASHFVLLRDDLSSTEMNQLETSVKDVEGITSVLSYHAMLGSGIPDFFIPEALRDMLKQGGWQMMMVNSEYPAASDQVSVQLKELERIIKSYDPEALITGEAVLTDDLIDTSAVDFKVTNYISLAAIFLIIMVVFRSLSMPLVLVAAIELSIFINQGIPYFTGTVIPFVSPTIIGCVQLGATVDYAILMTTRTREELGRHRDIKTAVRIAASKSAPSIITSGCSFFAACIGVALISRMDMISSLCELLARGALISVISIIFVLPSMLLAGNKLIAKTTRKWPHQERRNNI